MTNIEEIHNELKKSPKDSYLLIHSGENGVQTFAIHGSNVEILDVLVKAMIDPKYNKFITSIIESASTVNSSGLTGLN